MSAELPPRRHSSYLDDPVFPDLDADSYTAHRLQHATPEHLHLTTRRCFIGPIPEGWLRSHRREWYRHFLHINYSSREASFSANADVSRQRRLTGLDGPSLAARYPRSLAPPKDALTEEEDGQRLADGGEDVEATTEVPPAVPIPRSSTTHGEFVTQDGLVENEEQSGNTAYVLPSPEESLSPLPSKFKRTSPDEHMRSVSTTFLATASKGLSSSVEHQKSGDEILTEYRSDSTPAKLSVRPHVPPSLTDSVTARNNSTNAGTPAAMDSTTSLIPHYNLGQTIIKDEQRSKSGTAKNFQGQSSEGEDGPEQDLVVADAAGGATNGPPEHNGAKLTEGQGVAGMVRFNLPDDPQQREGLINARLAHMLPRKNGLRRLRNCRVQEGRIVKMEKMLIRVYSTMQQLPDGFDENDSQKVEMRTVEKWREYIVVCRESNDENTEFTLQLYKSRVIPAVEEPHIADHSKHEIPLTPKLTKSKLFSSLDKTIVIWLPWKKGTMIFVMQTRSGANAMEWYTFLRNTLSLHRTDTLQVNVPDLSVSLRLDKPFEQLEFSNNIAQAVEGDEEAIVRTVKEEQAIAGKIIDACVGMLENSSEWGAIVGPWLEGQRVGLAWKRYDRLEWVHGANERKMYGTIAMQNSHELELRPKQHYPTATEATSGVSLTEPAPVEGFLIRLTSQRGIAQRLGKLFFKRLYFSTHNQFLFFCRPARALPPPPPKLPMRQDRAIPDAHQIAEKIPLMYAVNPYPINDGEIEWLAPGGSSEMRRQHDRDAADEADRRVNTLLNCDGYINLCKVVKIRNLVRGASPADENVEEGSDVDFHEEVSDSREDDGTTKDMDDSRIFELVLRNGLVIRLQAFNKATKQEWQRHLAQLVNYWKRRKVADIELLKAVRRRNLEELHIDEETEAVVGQFARKWEVTKSFASPLLYNMCRISSCRTIQISGVLFRKPRRHSTFTRCSVILCHGQLLTFQDTLRSRTGAEIAHIQHERINSQDLADCYIYSGLITEDDLLYQNQTFVSNKPGHHALPRIYREDLWTSTDEDTMTCFVIWHGRRRGFFRSSPENNIDNGGKRKGLKMVSQLGVPGQSIVFRARSRAERDHWVTSIGLEIERLQRGDDVRIVNKQ